MGTRHIRTLYDIHLAGNHVKVACDQCRHTKIFDAGRLWWLFQRKGWSISLQAVPEHLRCSQYRGKCVAVTMTFEEPTGIQPTGPTDRQWKEHVRDQRR